MTAPRKIVPGRTYLLTRRCVQRQFLLTPSRSEIHEAFVFCLAYAAAKFDVEIHAAVCLGNHYHIVATDTKGFLSKFMHWLNRSTACCVNVELGRWGALWEDEGFSYVWLNGYIESFNGRLRDELLNREIFDTLREAQVLIERWRREYNHVRPHSSLGYGPPALLLSSQGRPTRANRSKS